MKEGKGKISSAKWVNVDVNNLKITVTALPEKEDFDPIIDIQKIIEFYSK
jgi:ribosomal protein S4